MDDALLKYDESLEALEKQRKDLERVMKRMGAEWEESGAGIGWMGDNLFKESSASNDTSPPLMTLMHSVTSSEPSHDYLQSLLHVNDELLQQSLTSTSESSSCNQSSNNSSSIGNDQMSYPTLVNQTTVAPPQSILPVSPISPEDDILITKDASISRPQPQPQQVINFTQFTPPITPE